MIRTLVSGAILASSLALPAFAGADVHEFLRSATPEQRREIREEIRDVREAKTPRERRQERAELKEEISDAREDRAEKRSARLIEGRASARGEAPRGNSMQALVARYAEANGVPAHVAHGVVMVESRYNARATGPGGYIGLMQIGYRTAKGMGYTGSRAGLYDPETNLKYGMRYLGEAYRQAGGSLCGAVSKYQGGHGVRGVTRAGAVYCGKVKTYMAKAAPAERNKLVAKRESDRG